ncbi:hypothetical protein AVO44_15855 [Ruegeria profundi]|uniref:Uncharacterized protein n=2 Tax=Ruegeria profundi TaxID=1685378 RepID=A0A0X3TPY1_9RHOB|nr:hypothetical protein AVO44_15855 [Ruegeria profundi]
MLERSLQSALADFGANGKKAQRQSLSQKLDLWKQFHLDRASERDLHKEFVVEIHSILLSSLEIRNRLAHGITGWSARAPGRSENASISTELNDKKIVVDYGELKRITEQTGTIASHMDRITSYVFEPDKWRHSDLHAEIRKMLYRSNR